VWSRGKGWLGMRGDGVKFDGAAYFFSPSLCSYFLVVFSGGDGEDGSMTGLLFRCVDGLIGFCCARNRFCGFFRFVDDLSLDCFWIFELPPRTECERWAFNVSRVIILDTSQYV
jgi:hypothetical protein